MYPSEKRCPYCGAFSYIDPYLPPEKCSKCGKLPEIKIRLRDTDRTRGGFTLEKQFNPNEFREKMLEFIYENPNTRSVDIAKSFRVAPCTVRKYVNVLAGEGLVEVSRGEKSYLRGRKPYGIICSGNYIPSEKIKEKHTLKLCPSCGEMKLEFRKNKCVECAEKQKFILNKFNELSAAAENNINRIQRCKNSTTPFSTTEIIKTETATTSF